MNINRKEQENPDNKDVVENLISVADELVDLENVPAPLSKANELTRTPSRKYSTARIIPFPQMGVCMIGNIYTDERCPVCKSVLIMLHPASSISTSASSLG